MKVLIIGSGGREHALAWKCAQSPLVEAVIFDFGYRLEGTLAGQRTHREYTRFGSRIGAVGRRAHDDG